MKSVYLQEAVRKTHERDGKSKRQIAKGLGIHRNTVSRILKTRAGELRRFQRQSWSCSVLGEYTGIIDTWLKEDELAPRKQRHTIKRIHERLKVEYNFTGSYGAVRDYVKKKREKPKEAFLPLAFQPGEMAQVD